MDAKRAIRSSADFSTMVLKTYISDLDDADLMCRPGPACNHLAWQLGHLISSEVYLLNQVAPGRETKLPEGFSDTHSKAMCGCDDANQFCDKQTYVELFDTVRAASSAALGEFPESALDDPSPEAFRDFCPTLGDMFTLIATHPMMHAGQFTVVRRQLGKPVLI